MRGAIHEEAGSFICLICVALIVLTGCPGSKGRPPALDELEQSISSTSVPEEPRPVPPDILEPLRSPLGGLSRLCGGLYKDCKDLRNLCLSCIPTLTIDSDNFYECLDTCGRSTQACKDADRCLELLYQFVP